MGFDLGSGQNACRDDHASKLGGFGWLKGKKLEVEPPPRPETFFPDRRPEKQEEEDRREEDPVRMFEVDLVVDDTDREVDNDAPAEPDDLHEVLGAPGVELSAVDQENPGDAQ